MKILFLVYHGFSSVSGISKKIHYQVKGLRENGHEVHLCYYDFSADGHRCRFVDDKVLRDYGTGVMAGLRQRSEYDSVYDYCIREQIAFVYARCFQNANPWLIRLFHRLRKAGVHAVTEIPTYPYDQEFKHFEWKARWGLKIDKLFRRRLYTQMDGMVTFSDAEEIFGQRTIRISNGVDFDSIPLHQYHPTDEAIHLIGVAEVHSWHGFDRLVAGIGEYQRKGGQRAVYFHIVGGVHPAEMAKSFTPLLEKYNLYDKIIFHGQLFGEALNQVFEQCQFAIGSLARHRSGITVIKTLKNREYASRGIPFIYSEQDSDFEHQSYILKAPADETPIDVEKIISFVDGFNMKPEEIRDTVKHLSWKIQMQRVVDSVFPPKKEGQYRIAYVTPALYMAGGVERVLTQKASYFADHYGYDVTIILTEGKGKPLFYPLSEKVKVVNLDINFEELWTCSLLKKILVYWKKQRLFKQRLTAELMHQKLDIAVSMMRREINFICHVPDGSKKIAELHVPRTHYRSLGNNALMRLFSKFWMSNLICEMKKLNRFVVLTDKERESWSEISNTTVIPNPLPFEPKSTSSLTEKRVVCVARYSEEKGVDLLLQAWAIVEKQHPDWQLAVYGEGDRKIYEQQMEQLNICRCSLNGRVDDVEQVYRDSSVFVLSSRFEGFGMVIVEAMACGLPVVSFDCPWGPRSIIRDGEDGLLAENGNVNELARKLSLVMGDESLRTSLAQAAIKNVQRFNIKQIAARWRELFDEVMTNR